jgi:hypothetical protein
MQSNSAFHESFRKEFEKNLLQSCERGSTDSRMIVYCTCADNEVEKHFDDAALTALGNGAASTQQRSDFQKIVTTCRIKAFKTN